MFDKIKQYFINLFRKDVAVAVAVVAEAPVVAEVTVPPVVAEAPVVVVIPHMIQRRERRLKRLQAIKNPPLWVLREIEELKQANS